MGGGCSSIVEYTSLRPVSTCVAVNGRLWGVYLVKEIGFLRGVGAGRCREIWRGKKW